jgi:hypothetical protein
LSTVHAERNGIRSADTRGHIAEFAIHPGPGVAESKIPVISMTRPAMNEHDDDIEPEVEEDAEFETEEFPILDDEESDESVDADDLDIDPDESEL